MSPECVETEVERERAKSRVGNDFFSSVGEGSCCCREMR